MRLKRIRIIGILVLLVLIGGVVSVRALVGMWQVGQAAASSNHANVVVFMMDDLDEDSFNQLLDNGKLPNIKNWIVDKGVRFTNSFVVDSQCCPSRATLLTGKYSHNTGVKSVVGSEGPGAFFSGNEYRQYKYLPEWLKDGSNYFTGFIGKFHIRPNTRPAPGWDFWREMKGYDARPGMYAVHPNSSPVRYPMVYQTKYIGDESRRFLNQAKNQAGRPFLLVNAPMAPHVYLPRWRSLDVGLGQIKGSSTPSHDTAPIVAWDTFVIRGSGDVRHQVIRGTQSSGYSLYGKTVSNYETQALRHNWQFFGKMEDIAPNTGSLPIVGFSVTHKLNDAGTALVDDKRQHLVRGNQASGYTIYERTVFANGGVSPWSNGTKMDSLLQGTKNLPLVSWSAIMFENGNIAQYIVRGSVSQGYYRYVRYKQWGRWDATFSLIPEGWELGSGDGELVGMGVFSDGRYLRSDMVKKIGANRYTYSFNDTPGYIGDLNGIGGDQFATEAEAFNVGYSVIQNRSTQASSYTLPHPYYFGRVWADGNWEFVNSFSSGTDYSHARYPNTLYPGGVAPAGSLRLGGLNGFSPKKGYDLPAYELGKPSRNAAGAGKPEWLAQNWPNLDQSVYGGRKQIDYMRRLHLDRLESMLTVDVMVGQVMNTLQANGQLGNTVVIFTSDNGHFNGEFRLGNKQMPWEESIRVPLIIRPPGGTNSQENIKTVANIDLAPTILDYAGKAWESQQYYVDGRSIRGLIDGGVQSWRKWVLIERSFPRNFAIASDTLWAWGMPDYAALRGAVDITASEGGNHLYVEYDDVPRTGTNYRANEQNIITHIELYDMNSDRYQMNNRYSNSSGNFATGYAQKGNALKGVLAEMKTCKGASCRNIEQNSRSTNSLPTSPTQSTTPPTQTPFPTPDSSVLKADFDNDSDVDIMDILAMVGNVFSNDKAYDINGDEIVDIYDFTQVVIQLAQPDVGQ